MFAQQHNYESECVYEDVPDPPGLYSYSSDINILAMFDPVVLNVHYWNLRDSAGTHHGWDLTEEQALESIQNLNIEYNQYGIFFKYKGLDELLSPLTLLHQVYDYSLPGCVCLPQGVPVNNCQFGENDPDGFAVLSQCQLNDLRDYLNLNPQYKDENAINVYVPRATTDFGGTGRSWGIVNLARGVADPLFVHEMGHYLNLSHTFLGWHSSNPFYTNCEHVTRDHTNPCDPNDPQSECYNADTKGDRVTDTAAMPKFTSEYCILNDIPNSMCASEEDYHLYYYDKDNCKYIGASDFNRGDCEGTLFQINTSQSKNFMSYLGDSGCADNFTTGQVIRMYEKINSGDLAHALADFSVLYEPYKGEYYVDQQSQEVKYKPFFQPGFHYRFVSCDCGPSHCYEPSPYEDTSFTYGQGAIVLDIPADETDFSKITHPNYTAIQILSLPNHPVIGQTTRRCYDNPNVPASDGTVTKFNDGVINYNVTVLPQDTTAINNPNLINTLDPGLYKIEKNYINSPTEQNIILKENNTP